VTRPACAELWTHAAGGGPAGCRCMDVALHHFTTFVRRRSPTQLCMPARISAGATPYRPRICHRSCARTCKRARDRAASWRRASNASPRRRVRAEWGIGCCQTFDLSSAPRWQPRCSS
jgi:hypothetical protein